jgi:O-succinylbenzoic acid--CoA ligase
MNDRGVLISIGTLLLPLRSLPSIALDHLPPHEKSALTFCHEWNSGQDSFTIDTSGSTGAPKKIELRRGQMIASAQKTIKALGLREGMHSLVCLDTNYIAGRMMIVRSIIVSMDIIIAEPSSNPLKDLPPSPIDFAALVPYQLRTMILSPERERLDSIGRVILGGAPIDQDLLSEINELKVPCYATFGMTETLSHIALQKLNGVDAQDSFHVLDGIEITTDDRQCLVIKADYLDETVVTNDIVELIGGRQFRWLGRFDNVINSGGVKVMPENVEKAVGNYMLSQQIRNRFFVTGLSHQQLGQQVVLVVEGMLTKIQEENLLKWLRDKLTRYEVPKQVLYGDKFTTTATQKVNRAASTADAKSRPTV